MPTNAALNILFHSKINGDLTELLDLKDYMAKQIIGDSKIAERVVKEDNIAFLQKQEIKRILGDRKKNNLTRSAEQNDQISKYNPFIYMEISQIKRYTSSVVVVFKPSWITLIFIRFNTIYFFK